MPTDPTPQERTATAFSRGVDIGMSGGLSATIFSPDGRVADVVVAVPCETEEEAKQLLAGVIAANNPDTPAHEILGRLDRVLAKARGKQS